MKLSTRGQYGLRAMVDLAEEYEVEKPIPLSEVAERQRIPGNYLEQLIRELRKAGLLVSVRGPKGGYYLSRPPEEISVGEVLRVVEGDLAPTDCVSTKGICDREDYCATHGVWEKLYDRINEVVDTTYLSDIIHKGQCEEMKE